ncbi:MCE family protein [Nocardia aurea]|uniref:MCE family protein n=1 Tax=Nocardia aurea TaxID=2144174 RepID=UPI0033B0A6A8
MILTIVTVAVLAMVSFAGGFTSTVAVTVEAPRSGLVLDPDAKVRMRGVEIGRVASIDYRADRVALRLAIDPDALRRVPANALVEIRSTTVFGAKYVNFVAPPAPSTASLRPGALVRAESVTVEWNTLFERLSAVLAQVEPGRLNATLAALGTALEGRGDTLGELLTRADSVLREINPSLPALRRDLAATGQVGDLYADAATDLLRTVDNATYTSATVAENQQRLDALLLDLIGLADTGGSVLAQNERALGTALDLLRPTAALLNAYSPVLTCVIVGIAQVMPEAEGFVGGLQPGAAFNTNFMFPAPPYKYPNDLPKVNATGGPHCDGVVDPVRGSHSDYLVTDTNQGAPYVPPTVNSPKTPLVFEILFAGVDSGF